MGKRKTNEELHRECQQRGCKLLTPERYKTRESDVWIGCSCGQPFIKRYKDFLATPRCGLENHDSLLREKQEREQDGNAELQVSEPAKFTEEDERRALENIKNNSKVGPLERALPLKFPRIDFSEMVNIVNKRTKFFATCKDCEYRWETCIDQMVGCRWCLNEFKNIHNFDSDTIMFIYKKKYTAISRENTKNKSYTFLNLRDDEIYSLNFDLELGCESNHKFEVNLKKFIRNERDEHCPCCPRPGYINWYHNKERLIKEITYLHPNDNFDFSLIKPEDIKSTASVPRIVCKNIKEDGEVCNFVFDRTIARLMHEKIGCRECRTKKKMTLQTFKKRAIEKYGKEFSYVLVTEEHFEQGSKSKVPIICHECSCLMWVPVNCFLNIRSHKKCRGCEIVPKKPWTPQRFLEEARQKEEEGEYRYDKTDPNTVTHHKVKIIVTCLTCENDFNPYLVNHFYGGGGCTHCSGHIPWDNERFQSSLTPKMLEKFSYDRVTNEIKGCHTIIEIGCRVCENYFKKTVFEHFTKEHPCPCCTKSQAARIAYEVLTDLNLKFETEYPIPGKNGGTMKFDYAIFIEDSIIFLEIDGAQHFIPVEFFGGEENFMECRHRDILKHQYAINHGRIIRIDNKVPFKNIKGEIIKGLQYEGKEYFSNPERYGWLYGEDEM